MEHHDPRRSRELAGRRAGSGSIDRDASSEYPIVAGRILLTDFETAHLRQTEDAARCQAWIVALSAATGGSVPGELISPVSGRPLVAEIEPKSVLVGGILTPIDEPI